MQTPPRLRMATAAAASLLVLAACSSSPEAASSTETASETPTVVKTSEDTPSPEVAPSVEEPEVFPLAGVVAMSGAMVVGSDGSQGPDSFCMLLTSEKRFGDDDQLVVTDAAGTVVGVGELTGFEVTEEEGENGATIRTCSADRKSVV